MKNIKVTVGWIARKFKNKVTSDPKIDVGNLVYDFRTIYGVEVDP